MSKHSTRVNIQLDEERAAKLRALAERVHLAPGALARSLLSTALDQADPGPATITALLDSIPGAYERAEQGFEQGRANEGIALEDL